MHRTIVGSFSFSSAVDGFRPIIIAHGFDSSQFRQSAYLYFLQDENIAPVFKLHSIHDFTYFLEELSDRKNNSLADKYTKYLKYPVC